MSDLHIHVHPDPALLAAFLNLKDQLTMKLSEITQGLVDANTQLGKIHTETVGLKQKVADLETVIASMDEAPPELVAAFEAVKAQLNVVDGEVPDATA